MVCERQGSPFEADAQSEIKKIDLQSSCKRLLPWQVSGIYSHCIVIKLSTLSCISQLQYKNNGDVSMQKPR